VLAQSLQKLVALASAPLCHSARALDPSVHKREGSVATELEALLKAKNGFYAFEGALHVLSMQSCHESIGIEEWNSPELWRGAYADLARGLWFFAEDAFGGQFCVREGVVCSFDPETGATQYVAPNLEDWARAILDDFEVLTGHPLARHWQVLNGAIPSGKRLVPRIPFACGGQYVPDNLMLLDAIEGMRLRGEVARQIAHLPPGTRVRFELGSDNGPE